MAWAEALSLLGGLRYPYARSQLRARKVLVNYNATMLQDETEILKLAKALEDLEAKRADIEEVDL